MYELYRCYTVDNFGWLYIYVYRRYLNNKWLNNNPIYVFVHIDQIFYVCFSNMDVYDNNALGEFKDMFRLFS